MNSFSDKNEINLNLDLYNLEKSKGIHDLLRPNDRKARLEILKKLPDPFIPSEDDPSKMTENDLEKLQIIIDTVKQGRSFINHLKSKREFNNPENVQKIIDQYSLEEIGSNLPGKVYNPYNVVTRPDEYYDGIIKKQNEVLMRNQKNKK